MHPLLGGPPGCLPEKRGSLACSFSLETLLEAVVITGGVGWLLLRLQKATHHSLPVPACTERTTPWETCS